MIVSERMTMTKCVRWCVVCLIAWAWPCGVAHAAQADWWDRLSGPGPFWGLSEDIRFLCMPVDSKPVWLAPWDPASSDIARAFSRRQPPIHPSTNPTPTPYDQCFFDTSKVRSFASITPAFGHARHNRLFSVKDDAGNPHEGRVEMYQVVGAYTVRDRRLALSTGFGVRIFEGSGFDTFARPIWAPVTASVVVRQSRPKLKLSASVDTLLNFSNADFCTGEAECNQGSLDLAEGKELIPHFGVHVGF
jgi:hypothetical protein